MVDKVLNEMIAYFGEDKKRINHALKVYGYARAISGNDEVPDESSLIVELAAILHDIGIREAERKHGSSAGKYQEIEGPPIAEGMMLEAGVERAVIQRVCHIVGNHHSYDKIDGTDFQILVEADFLVNIDEEAMNEESIRSIRDKYFRTAAGRRILESIYLQ